jgi:hypothetical protein
MDGLPLGGATLQQAVKIHVGPPGVMLVRCYRRSG